jgi:hypothetical protein
MSRFTPYRNLYGDNLTNADLIDTTDNLALIIQVRDLANFFPGVMDVGAFRRVDNIVNGAVVTGLIPQRPNYRFHNHVLFENVQATSADGNPTATDDSAFFINQQRNVLVLEYTHDDVGEAHISGVKCKDSEKRPFTGGEGGSMSCAELAVACQHPEHGPLVRQTCPRTCQVCVDPVPEGVHWRPLHFHNLPGELTRRPFFNSPYHYRLDWQVCSIYAVLFVLIYAATGMD